MTIDATGFDRDYYLARYPDVAAAGIDPYRHFLDNGRYEGRDPNPLFDTSFYLAANPDVAAAGIDPLEHYMRHGWREGRDPSRAFDTSDYLDANPDVRAAGVNPVTHYLLHGQAERRPLALDYSGELREGFDRTYYLKANPDVAAAGIDPYLHYQSNGEAEGRAPNALFDKAFYLARNPDVAAAGVDPLQHFLDFGWREGRDPSADFGLADYRVLNATPANENPLTRYLTTDRYQGVPSELLGANPPAVVVRYFGQLNMVLAGQANLVIDGSRVRFDADASPLDGHTLVGFSRYDLTRSTADIAMTGIGTGKLAADYYLGAGDNRISGAFTFEGPTRTLSGGQGTLTIDAQFNEGIVGVNAGAKGGTVTIGGSTRVLFYDREGADIVRLGAANDSISAGKGGNNHFDGGAGADTVSWSTAVYADLLTGRAVSIGAGAAFADTLVSIEDIYGSSFGDVLLGDGGPNGIGGGGGDDMLAGRDGDDTLNGNDGDDILIAGRGADLLFGGAGDDLLVDRVEPWGPNFLYPQASGGEGDDRIVALLGERGQEERGYFMSGGYGTDTYIIDPSEGRWGSIGLQLAQYEGDRIDLSALRTANGETVTLDYVRQATSTPFFGSVTLALSAFHDAAGNALEGRIVINGVYRVDDLNDADFIFTGGSDWRADIPADLLPLI